VIEEYQTFLEKAGDASDEQYNKFNRSKEDQLQNLKNFQTSLLADTYDPVKTKNAYYRYLQRNGRTHTANEFKIRWDKMVADLTFARANVAKIKVAIKKKLSDKAVKMKAVGKSGESPHLPAPSKRSSHTSAKKELEELERSSAKKKIREVSYL
jgi:hypothetical protein